MVEIEKKLSQIFFNGAHCVLHLQNVIENIFLCLQPQQLRKYDLVANMLQNPNEPQKSPGKTSCTWLKGLKFSSTWMAELLKSCSKQGLIGALQYICYKKITITIVLIIIEPRSSTINITNSLVYLQKIQSHIMNILYFIGNLLNTLLANMLQ